MAGHLSRQFDQELDELSQRLAEMAAYVVHKLVCAVDAGLDCCREACARTAALERDIDELAVRMLALRQPAGRDVRVIAMTLKLTGELSRCAALVGEITAAARVRSGSVGRSGRTKEHARLLESAIRAFTLGDAELARDLVARSPGAGGQLASEGLDRCARELVAHAVRIAERALYVADGDARAATLRPRQPAMR